MKNKILVLGNGFLGKEFSRCGLTTWGKDKFFVTKEHIDYNHQNMLEYDIIINCIAKSNTRWCEENFQEAMFVNGHLPWILSRWCHHNNKKFIHISTGCLYDDTTKDNKEVDFTAAHCNYTVTKWTGEMGCNTQTDIILRPRLLFSDVKDKNNLLCKLPNYDSYVEDKKDSLTSTREIVIAACILSLYNDNGIFNISQQNNCSIAEIVKWCNNFNKEGPIKTTTIEKIRNEQKLHLVNNTMDISKIQKYYTPINIEQRIKECYNKLNETSNL